MGSIPPVVTWIFKYIFKSRVAIQILDSAHVWINIKYIDSISVWIYKKTIVLRRWKIF